MGICLGKNIINSSEAARPGTADVGKSTINTTAGINRIYNLYSLSSGMGDWGSILAYLILDRAYGKKYIRLYAN